MDEDVKGDSDMVFFDDFSNGIWTKYAGNPVMVRSQLSLESDYICEPNVVYKDGVFYNPKKRS